jgi:putative spermidine/putrescine transport system ATP-binding protein
MLRPERLRILDGAAPVHLNLLRGTVQAIVYQGDSFLLQARLADDRTVAMRGVSAGSAMAAIPAVGAAVTLGLAAEDTILLPDEGAAP